jgi:hypothetical protein
VFTSDQIPVGSTAVLVVPVSLNGRPGQQRGGPTRYVVVKNIGPPTVWIGGSDVTPDLGVPIVAGGSFPLWLYANEEVWGVTDPAATATVSYVQSGA